MSNNETNSTAVQLKAAPGNFGIKPKKKDSFSLRVLKDLKANKYVYIMALPIIAYYLLFHYGPMYGVIIAFKKYNFIDGILGSPWVGFTYFIDMFRGTSFLKVFRNTVIISSYKLLFGFPAPIILALLFNEIRNTAFKKISQTISYLPYFLSWVVLGGVVIQFLSPSLGPLGYFARLFDIKPVNVLADVHFFRGAIIATSIWKSVGWGSVVYLAAIAGVNPELYESDIVDGASRFKRVLHITIPSVLPVVTIMFILNIGNIIYDDFDQIFNLYNPAVYEVGDVIGTYVYRSGLVGMKYSYATAVGLFRNVIAIVLVLTSNFIINKTNEYSLW
jgi:putative aldouronate transport system permease protein